MSKYKKKAASAAAALGFAAAFWPLGAWFSRRMADGGDEPYGLIVLGILTLLISRERRDLSSPASSWRFIATAVSFVFYILSVFWLPPMLRCVPAIFCLSFYYGWYRRAGWIALLFLSLPVVASLQFYLGYPLRLISTETTRWLVWPFVNEIVREGTTLTAYGKVVGVDPPCSGIRILWMGLIFTNILTSLVRMNWARTIVFNLFAIVLLLLSNSVRAALLFAPESGVIEISDTLHESMGLLCYFTVVLILIKVASLRRAAISIRSSS